MTVVLQADLVDAVVPGDDVEVTGIVLRRWKGIRPGARCELDLVLQARRKAQSTKHGGATEPLPCRRSLPALRLVALCGVDLGQQTGRSLFHTPMQALHVAVATVKQGAVTVTEDDAAAFEAFWERHKDAPLKGRDAILR